MRIRFDFGSVTLDAELLDTPTAKAIAAALPLTASVLTWGEEVYFDVPVKVARENGCARGRHPGRDRLLAGGPRHCHRLWPHADLARQRDAAGQPLQHLGESAWRCEDPRQSAARATKVGGHRHRLISMA